MKVILTGIELRDILKNHFNKYSMKVKDEYIEIHWDDIEFVIDEENPTDIEIHLEVEDLEVITGLEKLEVLDRKKIRYSKPGSLILYGISPVEPPRDIDTSEIGDDNEEI